MARTKKASVNINVRVPGGVKVPKAVLSEAAKAAQAVIDSQITFVALSKELAAKGISISADELARRSSGGTKVSKAKVGAGGKRRRTVLSVAQRKEIISNLKGGATVGSQAKAFACSGQTVMNIKKAAGLVKAKVAKKKAGKPATKKAAAKKASKKPAKKAGKRK